MKQALQVHQSLWAMELRRPGMPEPPLEEKIERIAAAGFAGVALDLAEADLPIARAAWPLIERNQLAASFNAFPKSSAELSWMLSVAGEFGCASVTVIGQLMPISIADMIATVLEWQTVATLAGIQILFETHRHSLTNDLYSTLAMIEAVPDMRLSADLSHYVVDRELHCPITREEHAQIHLILERAEAFQGRVASGQQIQLPLSFPQHRKWLDLFASWWRAGFASWRARNGENAVLTFLCELGPPEYALTDCAGHELSDRWEEALFLKALVESIWAELIAEDAAPAAVSGTRAC